MKERLRVAFVRRGYSPTGGAEAYLKRLARGVIEAEHEVQLIATNEWPEDQWPFGTITRLRAESVIGFADELEQIRPQIDCDALLSLERVWNCDVYRAGDGVHRAWLERRRKFELPLKQFARALNRKHRDLLHLEESLFASHRAGRVIVASQMVKKEIVDLYGYPADRIDIVHNGVPLEQIPVLFRASGKIARRFEAETGSNCAAVCRLWLGAQRIAFCNPGDGALQE